MKSLFEMLHRSGVNGTISSSSSMIPRLESMISFFSLEQHLKLSCLDFPKYQVDQTGIRPFSTNFITIMEGIFDSSVYPSNTSIVLKRVYSKLKNIDLFSTCLANSEFLIIACSVGEDLIGGFTDQPLFSNDIISSKRSFVFDRSDLNGIQFRKNRVSTFNQSTTRSTTLLFPITFWNMKISLHAIENSYYANYYTAFNITSKEKREISDLEIFLVLPSPRNFHIPYTLSFTKNDESCQTNTSDNKTINNKSTEITLNSTNKSSYFSCYIWYC
jgi:hypothetical protein